jgi:hypothetical protein
MSVSLDSWTVKQIREKLPAATIQHNVTKSFIEARNDLASLAICECLDHDVPWSEIAQCPAGHLVCIDCLKQSIEVLLSEGRSEVRCAAMGCDCQMSHTELERILPAQLLKRLVEGDFLKQSRAAKLVIRWCSKCGFGGYVEAKEATEFCCLYCQTVTGIRCGRGHPNGLCEECLRLRNEQEAHDAEIAQQIVDEEIRLQIALDAQHAAEEEATLALLRGEEEAVARAAEEAERQRFERAAAEEALRQLQTRQIAESEVVIDAMKKCPGCLTGTDWIGGCNHMTCPCGQHWCWLCQGRIDGLTGISAHYNDPGGPPACHGRHLA